MYQVYILLSILTTLLASTAVTLNHLNGSNSTKVTLRITVVCMQRNEVDMLGYWFRYYSTLVGIDNILMLDNYSDNPEVIHILEYWETQGATVIYNIGPYERKPYLLLDMARLYKPKGQILLVTDSDEFLVSFPGGSLTVRGSDDGVISHSDEDDDSSGNGNINTTTNTMATTGNTVLPHMVPTFKRSDIYAHIRRFHLGRHAAIQMLPSYLSVPQAPRSSPNVAIKHNTTRNTDVLTSNIRVANLTMFEIFHYKPVHSKIMYKLHGVTKLDHGNHHVHVRRGMTFRATRRLGFLHYHSRDPRELIERALRNAYELKQLPHSCNMTSLVHSPTSLSSEYSRCKSLLDKLIDVQTTKGWEKLVEIQNFMLYGMGYFLKPYGTADGTRNIYTSRHHPFVTLPALDDIIDLIADEDSVPAA